MRKILWWWPLVLALALCVAVLGSIVVLDGTAPGSPLRVATSTISILGTFAVPALLAWFLVRCIAALNRLRYRVGLHTRAERAAEAERVALAAGYERGRRLAHQLRSRRVPQVLALHDVLLNPDERAFLDAPMRHARFYGTTVEYAHTTGIYWGSTAFMVGAALATAVGNASRRQSALAAAGAQWREHLVCRTIVTQKRVLCRVRGQWLSFWYADMAAVHPEPDHSTMTMEFHGVEPLTLSGVEGPSLAVLVMAFTRGSEVLATHPQLARIAAG